MTARSSALRPARSRPRVGARLQCALGGNLRRSELHQLIFGQVGVRRLSGLSLPLLLGPGRGSTRLVPGRPVGLTPLLAGGGWCWSGRSRCGKSGGGASWRGQAERARAESLLKVTSTECNVCRPIHTHTPPAPNPEGGPALKGPDAAPPLSAAGALDPEEKSRRNEPRTVLRGVVTFGRGGAALRSAPGDRCRGCHRDSASPAARPAARRSSPGACSQLLQKELSLDVAGGHAPRVPLVYSPPCQAFARTLHTQVTTPVIPNVTLAVQRAFETGSDSSQKTGNQRSSRTRR